MKKKTMNHKLSEVEIDKERLLQPGYNAEDMFKICKSFTINTVLFRTGEKGEYAECAISGKGLDEGKPFKTGAQNIVVKLKAASSQDLLPLDVTISKHGNAYDIE